MLQDAKSTKERFEEVKVLLPRMNDVEIARQMGFKSLEDLKRRIDMEEKGLKDSEVLTTDKAVSLISHIIGKEYTKAAFRAQLKKKTLIQPLPEFSGRANCFSRKDVEIFAHFLNESEEEHFKRFKEYYLKNEDQFN